MCKSGLPLVLSGTILSLPLQADRLKPFPWFNRSDPKIQTEIFVRGVDLNIARKRIVIYPFEFPNRGRPDPFPFGPALEQALFQEKTSAAEYIPGAPWESPLPRQVKDITDRERRAAALADSRSRDTDLVVVGRVHSAFRTAGGGLVVNVTLYVLSAQDGRILWYGRKRADWIRRFPREDCLLHVASSFVEDWRSGNQN